MKNRKVLIVIIVLYSIFCEVSIYFTKKSPQPKATEIKPSICNAVLLDYFDHHAGSGH